MNKGETHKVFASDVHNEFISINYIITFRFGRYQVILNLLLFHSAKVMHIRICTKYLHDFLLMD
jgi:hypothetical protein